MQDKHKDNNDIDKEIEQKECNKKIDGFKLKVLSRRDVVGLCML